MSRKEPLYQLDGFVQIPIRMPITSLTFLHLHHDVEFVVHSEMSTCRMDNHAFLSFTFGTIGRGGWLLWKCCFTKIFSILLTFLKNACHLDGILLNSSTVDLNLYFFKGFLSYLFTSWHYEVFNGLPLSGSLLCLLLIFNRAIGCIQLYFHIWPMFCWWMQTVA